MSFVRPEARIWISKWRDLLIGIAVSLLGLYWLFSSGLLVWLGGTVLSVGILLSFLGLQRARFHSAGQGPGVVSIDEGEISYFGPFGGGTVAVRELLSLSLDPCSKPPVWVLSQAGQSDLHIPVNAEGADALFDAFASLPGIRTDHLLASLQSKQKNVIAIWAKRTMTLH